MITGKVSWFGGPDDTGVAPDEGLAFIYDVEDAPHLFLPEQPPGTTGLARRLNPDVYYIACRWDYDITSKDALLTMKVLVRAPKTGRAFEAYPADWGPHEDTGRIADISPGLMSALGIETDDEIEIMFKPGEDGMSETIQPMVVDLSHWDPAEDYADVKRDGIVAVIYKATQGTSYTDPTYVDQQHAAKAAGLLWGSYHFAEATDVDAQVQNYLRFAAPDPDEVFCLDWEDLEGNTMSANQAKDWITKVETALHRPNECVIYSGNTAKELIDGSDPFFGSRRLWLAQYGTTPVPQESWSTYWLWQFTDGIYGPQPHSIDGIGPCDVNSYAGSSAQLIEEWASAASSPGRPPRPPQRPQPFGKFVDVDITASDGVRINVSINGIPSRQRSRRAD